MEWTDTHLGLSDNLNSDLPWSVINVPTTLLQAICFLLCQCLMLASVRINMLSDGLTFEKSWVEILLLS